MKKRKIFKLIIVTMSSLLLLIMIFISIVYYNKIGKYPENEKKYPNYIGYINPKTALLNEGELCDNGKIFSTHHGAPEYAYKKNKKHFRDFILSEYNSKNYTDSGYLNFRFLVNCEGKAGWFEINELNLDLEETNLNDDMVNQLLSLTAKEKNWNTLQSRNYYMYILYRIENGKITEILP